MENRLDHGLCSRGHPGAPPEGSRRASDENQKSELKQFRQEGEFLQTNENAWSRRAWGPSHTGEWRTVRLSRWGVETRGVGGGGAGSTAAVPVRARGASVLRASHCPDLGFGVWAVVPVKRLGRPSLKLSAQGSAE